MNGKILGPGSVSVPAVLNIAALENPDGSGPETLRDRWIAVALHGIMSRESSTLASSEILGRAAVAAADAALRYRDAPRTSPASCAGPSGAGQEG